MSGQMNQRTLITTIVVGLIYFITGVTSASFAGSAASNQLRFFWRLSAFAISALVFAAHIAYEHYRRGNTASLTAWHTSIAAALGGFGLAASANIHELSSTMGYRPRMLVAFIAWPLLTGVPAFVVAWEIASGLRLIRRPV